MTSDELFPTITREVPAMTVIEQTPVIPSTGELETNRSVYEDLAHDIVRLSDIEDEMLMRDDQYLFDYVRVVQPCGTLSNYFVLHYKEVGQEQWITCKTLLSTAFTAIATREVIRQISVNLDGEISNEKHYRSGPSVRSSFTLDGYQIDIEDEPDVDKVLFQLITNINPDLDLLTTANLTFNIINGFSGNHALQLNYGLLKTITLPTEEGDPEVDRVIPVNNIFILDRFTQRLIHDNHLSINIEDVTNVQRSVQNQIRDYRRVSFTREHVDEFLEKFPKKFGRRFAVLYDSLPDTLKNFYYITYLFSVILETEKRIGLEIKLRTFITERLDMALIRLDSVQ